VTHGADVIGEQAEADERNLLAAASLNSSEKKIYDLLSIDEPKHIDDMVEGWGLNSSKVLATLFDLEIKGIIRQMPGEPGLPLLEIIEKQGFSERATRGMNP
jgi:predicted Rossmann fold nucleotide-binding protein DprA/Smf involved in DNA uptake